MNRLYLVLLIVVCCFAAPAAFAIGKPFGFLINVFAIVLVLTLAWREHANRVFENRFRLSIFKIQLGCITYLILGIAFNAIR